MEEVKRGLDKKGGVIHFAHRKWIGLTHFIVLGLGTLFASQRRTAEKREVEGVIHGVLTVDTLVPLMLDSKEKWEEVNNYIRKIMQGKREI
ncbi:hypothetical protein J6590_028107 [Homalodisca vitripennis]|nr:hypothetical protein J6590_028107 [Homalodisca vitripennis]